MSKRFKVTGLWVVHKRQRYEQGDLLPEAFTERDRIRNIYSRRITEVEIEDILPTDLPKVKEPPKVTTSIAGVKPLVLNPTGTSTNTVKVAPAKTTTGR